LSDLLDNTILSPSNLLLAVVASSESDQARAQHLAQQLALPFLGLDPDRTADDTTEAVLIVSGSALSLKLMKEKAPAPLAVDFGNAGMRHRRRAGSNELVGRAVGCRAQYSPRVIDATAGLGRDAFVLADIGCQVLLCERNPIVGALLTAGFDSAQLSTDGWLCDVLSRMELHLGAAQSLSYEQLSLCDVIYLDPMFPTRSKSAAVKKEMALFQMLLPDHDEQRSGDDANQLLAWALDQDVARVVVKRGLRSPSLSVQSPSHCITGKSVRYDVYVRRKLG